MLALATALASRQPMWFWTTPSSPSANRGQCVIAKKQFIVDVEAVVPEPTTALLAVMAFSGLGLIAGRRRG